MFTHVMVGTNDIDKAKNFYDKVLGVLGAPEAAKVVKPNGQVMLFYRHQDNVFVVAQPRNAEPATVANGATIGFKCDSPEQVEAFHQAAVECGGKSIEDPPGLRELSTGKAYVAYVRDVDGHKLCAVYRFPPTK